MGKRGEKTRREHGKGGQREEKTWLKGAWLFIIAEDKRGGGEKRNSPGKERTQTEGSFVTVWETGRSSASEQGGFSQHKSGRDLSTIVSGERKETGGAGPRQFKKLKKRKKSMKSCSGCKQNDLGQDIESLQAVSSQEKVNKTRNAGDRKP